MNCRRAFAAATHPTGPLTSSAATTRSADHRRQCGIERIHVHGATAQYARHGQRLHMMHGNVATPVADKCFTGIQR
jgi:hypothetical protein